MSESGKSLADLRMFKVGGSGAGGTGSGSTASPSAGNIQGALHTSRYLGDGSDDPKRRKRKRIDKAELLPPLTLYINRPVLNADELIAWAKSQGFKTTLPADDMHVTIAFSRQPLYWEAVGPALDDTLEVRAGNDRTVLQFGGGATVLQLSSPELRKRWSQVLNAGGSWDWEDYRPHVTLSFEASDLALGSVDPFRGAVLLGPEAWAEIRDDWKDSVVEKTAVSVTGLAPLQRATLDPRLYGKPRPRPEPKDIGTARGRDEDVAKASSWQDDIMQKVGARHSKNDRDMIQQMHDHAVKLGAECSHDEPHDEVSKAAPDDVIEFGENRIAKVDDSLGLVFGYAIISKINGEPYYDLNVDPDGSRVPEHIPEQAMLKAAAKFMETGRVGNEMHKGEDKGTYLFAFPLTSDIAKAMGISGPVTGLMVAYKPPPELLEKFKDGTYTGFSIEGKRIAVREIE